MEHDFTRILEKNSIPTEAKIVEYIGISVGKAWRTIKQLIEDLYNFVSETVFYVKKYDWIIRYRKSGKS